MNKIPVSVPVYIEQFAESSESDRYSKAKLKVFYVGETADHRLFTQEFSDKVKETLPLTPVVGFYSEESQDFKGHNKVQYVYGVVPDGAKIEYEEDEENGNKYLVTDVILYTERKDNIGEVAKKIVGKQHSLELNPDTLKYKINRDGNGVFKNVEFTDGQFIGLSVLGDNETPAFEGAGFFMVNSELTEDFKDKFNKFIDILNHNGGSIEVFDYENYFNKLQAKFAAMTMQDFIQKIYQALDGAGIYGYVVENTDSYAIVDYWSDEKGGRVFAKYSISLVDDQVVLGESEEVFPKYLTQSELDAIENAATASAQGDSSTDDSSNDEFAGNANDSSDEENGGAGNCADNTNDSSEDSNDSSENGDENNDEGAGANASLSNEKGQEEENQVGAATASASTSTLSDSERAELENYRKQEKVGLINEYRNELPNEVLDNFIAECDKFSKDEIEAKLAIEYRKFLKSHPIDEQKTKIMAFNLIAPMDGEGNYDKTDPAQVINKYAKK